MNYTSTTAKIVNAIIEKIEQYPHLWDCADTFFAPGEPYAAIASPDTEAHIHICFPVYLNLSDESKHRLYETIQAWRGWREQKLLGDIIRMGV